MTSVKYGTQTIEFEVQRSEKNKHTYISVQRDRGVLVKAPQSVSNEEIKTLVKNKAAWIIKKLESLGEVVDYGEVVTGSRLFYMGKSYYVELLKEERTNYEVNFIHSKFKISTPKYVDQSVLNQVIETFYLEKAKEKITRLVKKWSKVMQLFPEHVGFRKSQNKWATCSERNRLTFNPEVMKLSSSLIEYVVVHELAHIAHKNHSKEFWNLVRKFMNNYLKKKEELQFFEKKL